MKSREPTKTDPTGAPSPLERQNIRDPETFPYDAGETPDATDALKMRDPSRCRATDALPHTDRIRLSAASGNTVPPPALWVFSTATRRTFEPVRPGAAAMADATSSGEKIPPGASSPRVATEAMWDTAGLSRPAIWDAEDATITSPGRVQAATAHRFPMVPEGTNMPPSLPKSAAEYSSSARTEGSSPRRESPTFARDMACRIPGVGSVTVSERRSIVPVTGGSHGGGEVGGARRLRAQLDQFPVVQEPPPGGLVQRLARDDRLSRCGLKVKRVIIPVPPVAPEGEHRLAGRDQQVGGGVFPDRVRVAQDPSERVPQAG